MRKQAYTIRRATFNDVASIAKVTQQAWIHTVPFVSAGHHETDARVHEDLTLGGGLVLELNAVVIGSVRWFPDHVANAWEVMRLGIMPAFRGQGWGASLMGEVARLAHGDGVPELRIFVEVGQSQLVAWYQRQGFVMDETPDYARQDTQTPPLMLRKFLQS